MSGGAFHPVGSAALAFLRRVRTEGRGVLSAETPGERCCARVCLEVGYLQHERRGDDVFRITSLGSAYLDRIAGAH